MVGRTKEDCPQGSAQACLKHTHTHARTQISTVASAHIDVHTDALIHTRAALRQRPPCLTTTTDLVKQREGGGNRGRKRVERDAER